MYTFVDDIWDWKKDFKGLLANIINVDHILPYIQYTYIILWDLYCFDSRATADMTKTCCSQNDLRCNASLEAITSDRLYREFTWSVSQMLFDQNYFDLIFILQFFLNPKTPVDLQVLVPRFLMWSQTLPPIVYCYILIMYFQFAHYTILN